MADGHGLWSAMSVDVQRRVLAFLTGGRSVSHIQGAEHSSGASHASTPERDNGLQPHSPTATPGQNPQGISPGNQLHGTAPEQGLPNALPGHQLSGQLPPEQRSPATLEAAQLLMAQLSRATAPLPPVALASGSGHSIHEQQGAGSTAPHTHSSRGSAAPDTQNRTSRQWLSEISRSITDCMAQIDRIRRQPNESHHEEQELMLRVESLEAQLCSHLHTQTAQPPRGHQPATHKGGGPPQIPRAHHHIPAARGEVNAPPRGDAPTQLAATFESLLQSAYNSPVHSHVGGTCPMDNGCQFRTVDSHHVSVSEANYTRRDPVQLQDPHGGAKIGTQSMASDKIRECLRDLQGTRDPPAARVTQRPHTGGWTVNHRKTSNQCCQGEEDAAPPGHNPADLRPSRGHRVDKWPPQNTTAPHGSPWWNRELRMPKFKGEPEENPLDFLTKFKRFAAALPHLSLDEACRQCMPVALTEEAEQWLNTQLNRWPNDYTYQEFSAALTDRFLPHDYVDRMRRFLETRMQGESETLARFITVIETAYDRSGVAAPDREVVRRICSQLNPTYNQLIGHRYFGSLDELLQHARSIDAQVHRQRSFKVIEADCPDADLKVKAPSASHHTHRGWRRGQQKPNAAPGSDNAQANAPPDGKEPLVDEPKAADSSAIKDKRRCYNCGDPSHMSYDCPLPREQGLKRGSKNGRAPPSNL